MLEYLSIGQIVNTHGVRGEVKIYPLTDEMDRFNKLKKVYIETNNGVEQFDILSVKLLSSTVVVKLKGIDTVEQANKYRNKYIKIDRQSAVKLPKDSYFICDLIDIEVFDNNEAFIGCVKDVIKTGSNDVYVVKGDGKEILIPALKSIVKEINMSERKIIVELPEGLL